MFPNIVDVWVMHFLVFSGVKCLCIQRYDITRFYNRHYIQWRTQLMQHNRLLDNPWSFLQTCVVVGEVRRGNKQDKKCHAPTAVLKGLFQNFAHNLNVLTIYYNTIGATIVNNSNIIQKSKHNWNISSLWKPITILIVQ